MDVDHVAELVVLEADVLVEGRVEAEVVEGVFGGEVRGGEIVVPERPAARVVP